MMRKRRSKKELTSPVGTSYIDGRWVYTETGETLFRVTPLVAVYRDTLTSEQSFSPDDALKLLEKYYKKKHTECYAYLTEKRLILTKRRPTDKTPFRTWVAYPEIVDIRRGIKKLDAFVISINSKQTGKRYYEIYRCKSKEEARKFEDLIRRALEQPEGRLQGDDLQTQVVYEYSNNSNLPRSLNYHQFTPSLPTLREDDREEKEDEMGAEQSTEYDDVGHLMVNPAMTSSPTYEQPTVPVGDARRNPKDGDYLDARITVATSPTGDPWLNEPKREYTNVQSSDHRPGSWAPNHRLLVTPTTTADLYARPGQSKSSIQPAVYTDVPSPPYGRISRFAPTTDAGHYPSHFGFAPAPSERRRLATPRMRASSLTEKRFEHSCSVQRTHEVRSLPDVTYFKFDPRQGFLPSDTGPVYLYSLNVNRPVVNKKYL